MATAMLKKFRRSSQAKAQAQQVDEVHVAESIDTETESRTGFFTLPAELRNEIYRLAALDTNLCLVEPKRGRSVIGRKGSVSTLQIPGLMLTSRRVRRESSLILLSNAKINARITDFDFSWLIKAIGTLGRAQLEAVRANPNLRVTLRMKKCAGDVASGLREWCLDRESSMATSWTYELDESNMQDIRQGQAGAVRWYAVRASVLLEQEKDKIVRWELIRVLTALHQALKNETSNGPRNDSVLMRSSWRPMYI